MPGQYKLKSCPVCSTEHRKRGQYCSQSCANSTREITTETMTKIKRSVAEYQNSPEGLANAKRQALRASAMRNGDELPVTVEDFAVDIPDIRQLSDYDDILSGFDRADNW